VLTFDDGYRSVFTVGFARSCGATHWVGVLNLAVEHEWTDLPPRFIWKLLAAAGSSTRTRSRTSTSRPSTTLGSWKEVAGVAHVSYGSCTTSRSPSSATRPAGTTPRLWRKCAERAIWGATTTNYGPASPKQGYFTLDRNPDRGQRRRGRLRGQTG
jgi:hypothetical protein